MKYVYNTCKVQVILHKWSEKNVRDRVNGGALWDAVL